MKKYINYAKKLGDLPPNVCTPEYIFAECRKLEKHNNVTVECRTDAKGAFDAVAQGTDSQSVFIIITYIPKKNTTADYYYDVGLVGKGITFDTGGLNIKSTSGISSPPSSKIMILLN